MIAANVNNAKGIAGVDWNVKILPVRVLGKCVGGDSYVDDDLRDAIRWASGFTVAGVANPNSP